MIAITRNTTRTQAWRTGQLILLGMLLSIGTVIIISFTMFSTSFAKAIIVDYKYEPITVQKGDTLWALAAKNNNHTDIHVLVNKTRQYNNLSSTFIEPGQIIYIPIRV